MIGLGSRVSLLGALWLVAIGCDSSPAASSESSASAATTPAVAPREAPSVTPSSSSDASASSSKVAVTSPAAAGVTTASPTMGALRKPFRDCYQQWLEPGANLTLRLTLSVHVAADGGVTDVDPSVASPPTLIACLVKAAKAARFDPPSNGEATVVEIPVTFVTQ